MEIPAPLPDRQAVRRRRAHAREPRGRMRTGEADTTLPEPRQNLISAPLVRVSCRQKTAEQNYYNCFLRIETVPSWFGLLPCSCGMLVWGLLVWGLLVWGRAPSPVQAERSSAACLCWQSFRRDGACPVSLRGRRRGKPRLYPSESGLAPVSSFSRIIASSCETLPAPNVRTKSPGWASAVTVATASEKEGAYTTLPFPAPAMRLASASAVMPSIGFSL